MSATNRTKFSSIDDLESGTAEAPLQFGLAFADGKHFLGRRISEWVTGAPAMEAAVAAAAITQDELGHARSFYAMLRDIPGAPAELNPESDLGRTKIFAPRGLHSPFDSWFDVIAALFLFDTALTTTINAMRRSELRPLRQRAAKMMQEEEAHGVFARGWVMRMGRTGGRALQRLRASLLKFWPMGEQWFGPENDQVSAKLHAAALLSAPMHEQGEIWRLRLARLLDDMKFTRPQSRQDWSAWDARSREIVAP